MGRFCTCMKMMPLFFYRLQSCHNLSINQWIDQVVGLFSPFNNGRRHRKTWTYKTWIFFFLLLNERFCGNWSSEASTFILKDGWEAFRSAGLKMLLVKLLLSLVELPQLLGLPFAQLLPLHIVSGETLRATTNLIGFCLNLLQQQKTTTTSFYRFIKSGILVGFSAEHLTWRDLHLRQFSHLKR